MQQVASQVRPSPLNPNPVLFQQSLKLIYYLSPVYMASRYDERLKQVSDISAELSPKELFAVDNIQEVCFSSKTYF